MASSQENEGFKEKALGWIADNPDLRDYRLDSNFLDALKPENCSLNFKVIHEILKQVRLPKNSRANDLIKYLEFELEKYSVFYIQYFDVLKPQNSHPKVKEIKHHLNCFFNYIYKSDQWEELKPRFELVLPEIEKATEDKVNELLAVISDFDQLTHKDLIQWMRSEYYDAYLVALVKLFQVFVWQKQIDNKTKDEDLINIDGIIGIDTFKALTYWLNFGFAKQKDLRESQKDYQKAVPIPYPSPVPAEVLSQILISFLSPEVSKGLEARFDKSCKEAANSIQNNRLMEELLKGPFHANQQEICIKFHYYKLADFIAKEYYLLIEPLVLVALQFVGTIGAYENLEHAIKIAASQFKFIVDLDIDDLQKIIDNIKFQMKPGRKEPEPQVLNLEGLEDLKTVINLKIFGSTEKIPDEFRLELIQEVENLRWLQQISHWAIYKFVYRYYQDFLLSDSPFDCKKAHWDQKLCDDFIFLLEGGREQGNKKQEDEEIKGLVAETIKLGIKAIKKNSNENISINKKVIEEFLKKMREYLADFLDSLKDDSSVIEFVQEQGISEMQLELSKITEKEAKEKFGYRDIYKEPLPIFEFSSNYRIPVGDNLIRNIYWEKASEQGKQREYFAHLPQAVDLTYWCSPVSDQASLNACTAHAGVALLEYFARQYANDPESLSIPFLYKVTRNLANRSGNVGASPRETMRAMVSLGIPPARFWAVDEAAFDDDPPNFTYSVAQNYQALNYFRIDHADVPKDDLLTRIKIVLAAGFPCMFGFTLYRSMYDPFNVRRGFIPYPLNATQNLRRLDTQVENSVAVGGHAVVAVGYHNYKRVPFSGSQGYSQGAILIRNSWGEDWGIGGYGWLPYDYILNGLTADWWSLINAEWLKTGRFGLGGSRDFGGNPCAQGPCKS